MAENHRFLHLLLDIAMHIFNEVILSSELYFQSFD
uniref:Maturase K n=1 Tax=Romanomermis culicivorax TaxID=13658 RepID=A0A915JJJ4_ROMCU